MDRKDWVWVVIKAFGVYLGVETLLAVPGVFMVLTNLPSSGQAVFGFFSSFLVKAALSFYFLKSGRLVVRLIGPGAD